MNVVWEAEGQRARTPKATVVLLHGYMDAAGTWDLVAPALAAAQYRVIAPDLRGYGQGVRLPPGSAYHFADYLFDVEHVRRSIESGEVFLVGHSMGGVVATLFTAAFPESVNKLALLEGLGPPDHVPGTLPARVRAFVEGNLRAEQEVRKSMTPEEALRRLKVQHASIPEDVLRSRIPHLTASVEGAPDDSAHVVWRYDLRHRAKSANAFFASSFAEYAASITCPVLYVSGGATGYHPEDESARLAAFKTRTEATLEGAGHMMHWTQPQELAQVLLSFFAESAQGLRHRRKHVSRSR